MSPYLADWLGDGPFGLSMSSGFFGFFAHAGMLTVLEDEGLLPSRVSGSSAGALVGGAWAAGLRATELAHVLMDLRRESFWDPAVGPGLLRGALFADLLEALLPRKTFGECRVPVAMSIFDLLSRRVRVLESGALAPAIRASCAVPFLFHPVWIAGRPCADGGLTDRPGLAGMPSSERVFFHHLASRSPWRRRGSPSMDIPVRPNMTTLVIDALPRVGPFRLDQGPRAFEMARIRTRAALRCKCIESLVRA